MLTNGITCFLPAKDCRAGAGEIGYRGLDFQWPWLSFDFVADIWTKSKWTKEQLDGHKVEFQLPTHRGTIHDTGKFLVRRNPEGLLAVDILIDVLMGIGKWEQYRLHVPQSGVRHIEKHRDQSIAHFRLFV